MHSGNSVLTYPNRASPGTQLMGAWSFLDAEALREANNTTCPPQHPSTMRQSSSNTSTCVSVVDKTFFIEQEPGGSQPSPFLPLGQVM